MAKIIDFEEAKKKRKRKQAPGNGKEKGVIKIIGGKNPRGSPVKGPENVRGDDYAAKARERDAGWQVFAAVVNHVKNGGFSDAQALTVSKMLILAFGIGPQETETDVLIRAEHDGHTPDPRRLTRSGADIIFSLTGALRENLIDRQQAARIVKVISAWYCPDPKK